MAADKLTSRESVLTGLNELIGQRDTVDIEREIRRLSIALGNAAGKFSLFFAVCNNRKVEDYVSAKLLTAPKGPKPVELQLKPDDASLLDALSAAPVGGAPLIVHGIHSLLPSSKQRKGRRDRTLQEMQLRREQFRELARPVLLWMPEYAYTMVGHKAVDFWSWQTGGYFFPDELPESGLTQTIAISGDANRSTIITGDGNVVGTVGAGELQRPGPAQVEPPRRERFDWSDATQPQPVIRAAELARLKALLTAPDTRAVLISGMAGTGKTSLALVLAKDAACELGDHFPDGIFFVRLRQDDLSAAMRHMVSELGASARIAADEVTLRATYHAVLNRTRALLIFDDVEEPRAVLPILPEPPNKAIITSRKSADLPRVANLVLDRLSPKESVALLRNLVGPDRISDHQLEKLAFFLEYLPLSLSLAGSVLRLQPERTVGDFISEVESYKNKEKAEQAETFDASLQLAWDNLKKNRPELERKWLWLSVFAGQFDELAAGAVLYGKDFDEETLPAVHGHLTELTHRSLLITHKDGARYEIHAPIRQWARSQLTVEEANQSLLRHALYYLQILRHAEELYLSGDDSSIAGLDLFDRERPNIEAAWRWVAEQDGDIPEIEELCSEFADAAPNIVRLRLDPETRMVWLDKAVAAAQRFGDKGAISRHLASRGDAAIEMAMFDEGLHYFTQAISISREVGDRRGEGEALLRRGLALAKIRVIEQATADLEQFLQVSREIGDRRGEVMGLHNLGRMYADEGFFDRAVEWYEQALAGYREIGDLRGQGLALADLGSTYRQLEDFDRAIECLQIGLRVSQDIGDRRMEGSALANLGVAFENKGRIEEAIHYYREALSTVRRTGDQSEEAQVLGSLGLVYARQGDSSRAQSYLQQALFIDEKLLGPDNPRVATDASNIGLVLQDQGDLEGARAAFERALAIDESVLGPDHPNISIRLNNLGRMLLASGEARKAREVFERSLAIAGRTMGPEHTFTGTAQLNLGLAHRALGEAEEAKVALASALAVYEQALGPEHPNTQRVREIIESQEAF